MLCSFLFFGIALSSNFAIAPLCMTPEYVMVHLYLHVWMDVCACMMFFCHPTLISTTSSTKRRRRERKKSSICLSGLKSEQSTVRPPLLPSFLPNFRLSNRCPPFHTCHNTVIISQTLTNTIIINYVLCVRPSCSRDVRQPRFHYYCGLS